MMEIALVVAVADNGVIGHRGGLPWHLPGDLRRFRERTMGHHVVMGRLTSASIGRPLPGRTNLVVSRDRSVVVPGCTVVHSFDEAVSLAAAAGERELFVIGGSQLYREALPRADRIYWTEVHASPEGDVYFPPLDPAQWTEVAREALPGSPHDASAAPHIGCELVVLERARGAIAATLQS